jgi:hypothetical protein
LANIPVFYPSVGRCLAHGGWFEGVRIAPSQTERVAHAQLELILTPRDRRRLLLQFIYAANI